MKIEERILYPYGYLTEKTQFFSIHSMLEERFKDMPGRGILFGNFLLVSEKGHKCEVDAVFLTSWGMIGIEFKNHGGRIKVADQSWFHVDANGEPEMLDKENINVVYGGAKGTPLEQADHNRCDLMACLERFMKTEGVSKNLFFHYMIVFNQGVELLDSNGVLEKTKNWLTVTDNTNFEDDFSRAINKQTETGTTTPKWTGDNINRFLNYLGNLTTTPSDVMAELKGVFAGGQLDKCLSLMAHMGDDSEVCLLRGKCFYQKNAFVKAKCEFSKAKSGGKYEACYYLGEIALKEGSIDDAVANFECAVEYSDTNKKEAKRELEKLMRKFENNASEIFSCSEHYSMYLFTLSGIGSMLLVVVAYILGLFGVPWSNYLNIASCLLCTVAVFGAFLPMGVAQFIYENVVLDDLKGDRLYGMRLNINFWGYSLSDEAFRWRYTEFDRWNKKNIDLISLVSLKICQSNNPGITI